MNDCLNRAVYSRQLEVNDSTGKVNWSASSCLPPGAKSPQLNRQGAALRTI